MKLSVLLLVVLTVQAHAEFGSIGHGGGKVMVCVENGQEHVYLADTFELARAGVLGDQTNTGPEYVMDLAETYFEVHHPELIYPHPVFPERRVSMAWMVAHIHANLDFRSEANLQDLPDDNIDRRSLPENCHPEQLAIHELGGNLVRQNPSLLAQLSPLDRGFYELHETLLALRYAPGQDTTPIRKAVSEVFAGLHQYEAFSRELMWAMLGGARVLARDSIGSIAREALGADITQKVSLAKPPALPTPSRSGPLSSAFKGYSLLPTLLKIPAHMDCRVMNEKFNRTQEGPPPDFTLDRVQGSGKPGEWTTLSMRRSTAHGASELYPGNPVESRIVQFDTAARVPANQISPYGAVHIEIGFPNRRRLVLSKYIPRTGEFTGSFKYTTDEEVSGGDPQFSFGVSCFPDKAEFGMELPH